MIELKQRDSQKRLERYPEITNEIKNFINSQLNEFEDQINYCVVGEFEEGNSPIDFTINLYLKNGQLCYCKQPLEDDLSNWREVALQLCLGYRSAAENVREKQLEEGLYVPLKRRIIFDRLYGTYRFNDDEVEKLLNGDTIVFITDTLPREDEGGDSSSYKYVAVGKLEQCDYEGDDKDENQFVVLVGFRRWGFKRDMRYNRLKPYLGNHRFTVEEITRLIKGETLYIETTSKTKVNSKGLPLVIKANVKFENFDLKIDWVK